MGALTNNQKQIMYIQGFVREEVERFDNAKRPDGKQQDLNFQADNFQSMIRHRRDRVRSLLQQGWLRSQIARGIKLLYASRARHFDSFRLLQLEASPAAKYKRLSKDDIVTKLLTRARSARGQTTRTFGRDYTKPIPRVIPKPPRLSGM